MSKITIPAAVVVAVLLAFVGGVMLSQKNTLTAPELFKLRSDCGELARRKLAKFSDDTAFDYAQDNRYDPATNRCYVEIDKYPGYLHAFRVFRMLFDGQTDDLLADSYEGNEYSLNGHVYDPRYKQKRFNPTDATYGRDVHIEAENYINKLMEKR